MKKKSIFLSRLVFNIYKNESRVVPKYYTSYTPRG